VKKQENIPEARSVAGEFMKYRKLKYVGLGKMLLE
jgi:hypothetical protein